MILPTDKTAANWNCPEGGEEGRWTMVPATSRRGSVLRREQWSAHAAAIDRQIYRSRARSIRRRRQPADESLYTYGPCQVAHSFIDANRKHSRRAISIIHPCQLPWLSRLDKTSARPTAHVKQTRFFRLKYSTVSLTSCRGTARQQGCRECVY